MSVAITHGDTLTAYGMGLDWLWEQLCHGTTAIHMTKAFDRPGFVSNQAALLEDLMMKEDQSRVMALLERLLAPLIGNLDPNTSLLLTTTIGEVEHIQRSILEDNFSCHMHANPLHLLAWIKNSLGLKADAAIVSSACASASMALSRAAAMIRQDAAQQVLVVACDAVTEFLYAGFSGLLSLSQQPARPFDADRDGLSLGDGAAWALLSSDNAQVNLLQHVGTRLVGWGSTTDAVHMTAPDRQAKGLIRAITKACKMAGVAFEDISGVIAHGTATPLSDAMEITALSQCLPPTIPVMSIKGAIGHTCAATGLIQALVASHAIKSRTLPPTMGLNNPDPACDARYIRQAVELPNDALMLSMNSGFGGVNTAMLIKGGN